MKMPQRGSWHWWVSVLLLLATMINYMDRQTLANLSVRITKQFNLSNEQYGNLELYFGIAFAFGSLFFGALADRVSVRVLYPLVLFSWSMVGFVTGLTNSYESMLACRTLLGFFEAGHWPCALVVTHAIMTQGERAMGNSVLQSGASLGAILTPLIIRSLVGPPTEPDGWRPPFLIIGTVGVLWCILWLLIVRKGTIQTPNSRVENSAKSPQQFWLFEFVTNPKFWALVIMVVSINATWQLIRAWLNKFLQEGRGYSESEALYFNSAYFIATDIGCLIAGSAALWLARRGWDVHRSRLTVYAVCALLTMLTSVAAMLPAGWLLLGTLLLVGAALLGLFPCYYSFAQEISSNRLGKATGLLGFLAWFLTSPLQRYFGKYVDQTGSFDLGLAVVGFAPILGLIAMLVLWREPQNSIVKES